MRLFIAVPLVVLAIIIGSYFLPLVTELDLVSSQDAMANAFLTMRGFVGVLALVFLAVLLGWHVLARH